MTTKADTYLSLKLAELRAEQDTFYSEQKRYKQTPLRAEADVEYELHEYDGPQGKGWILHAYAKRLDGKVYHRQRDFGPEGRTHGWEAV